VLKKLQQNTFLAGSMVYLVSNIIYALIPFALLPVFTRYLSPEEYGEVAMFQVLLGGLTAFIGLSLQGAAGRKFYDRGLTDDDLSEFIGSCFQILLTTSVVALIILIGLGDQLSVLIGLDHNWILLAIMATASSIVVRIRLSQWQVRKKAKNYGMMQIFQSFLDIALSVVFVVVFSHGAGGRISGHVIAVGLVALLAVWLLKRDGLLRLMVWKPTYIIEALRIGVPLIPHVGGMFLLASVDRFVINAHLGLAQAGIYMVAAQFAMALALLFDAINKAYVPWLFERLKRDDKQEKQQIVWFTYAWYLLILCGAGLTFLIGPWLVTFVAGEEYSRAGDLIAWLALGQVFGGMYLMVTNFIFFSKRTGLLSLVTISSGLINVVLMLLLVGQFGLEGAAYAFCISMAIRFVLTWWVANKRHPMPWFAFNRF